MRKGKKKADLAEIRAEYDFSKGAHGKYAKRHAQGSNVVVLEPDVAKAFPDTGSVNRALRGLAELIRMQGKHS